MTVLKKLPQIRVFADVGRFTFGAIAAKVTKTKKKATKMGAIRVDVQLINTTDEALITRGLLAPHFQRSLKTEALVDTRVLALIIPPALVESLGLRIRRRELAYDANGFEEVIEVTEGVRIYCQGREAMVEALVSGNEVVIGRILLALMDLVVDRENHRLAPNPANPDYPVARI